MVCGATNHYKMDKKTSKEKLKEAISQDPNPTYQSVTAHIKNSIHENKLRYQLLISLKVGTFMEILNGNEQDFDYIFFKIHKNRLQEAGIPVDEIDKILGICFYAGGKSIQIPEVEIPIARSVKFQHRLRSISAGQWLTAIFSIAFVGLLFWIVTRQKDYADNSKTSPEPVFVSSETLNDFVRRIAEDVNVEHQPVIEGNPENSEEVIRQTISIAHYLGSSLSNANLNSEEKREILRTYQQSNEAFDCSQQKFFLLYMENATTPPKIYEDLDGLVAEDLTGQELYAVKVKVEDKTNCILEIHFLPLNPEL